MRRRVQDHLPKRVTLRCADGGCCPDLVVNQDGSIELSEFGQTVKLSSSSVKRLLEELERRGIVR